MFRSSALRRNVSTRKVNHSRSNTSNKTMLYGTYTTAVNLSWQGRSSTLKYSRVYSTYRSTQNTYWVKLHQNLASRFRVIDNFLIQEYEEWKIAVKIKGGGQMSKNSNHSLQFAMTQSHSKLHQLLVNIFLSFVARRDTQTDASKNNSRFA